MEPQTPKPLTPTFSRGLGPDHELSRDQEFQPTGDAQHHSPTPRKVDVQAHQPESNFSRESSLLYDVLSFSASSTCNKRGRSDQSRSTEGDRPETPPAPLHHVLDVRMKRLLVIVVSLAGMFSPLSSNIYLPAIGTIAKVLSDSKLSVILSNILQDLNVSFSQVNLSITIYLVFQGLAPSFWGAAADTKGRRPIFIGTLLLYLVSNIGLSLSPSYAVLMTFRGLQAAGSSATIALGPSSTPPFHNNVKCLCH